MLRRRNENHDVGARNRISGKRCCYATKIVQPRQSVSIHVQSRGGLVPIAETKYVHASHDLCVHKIEFV